jgi:hypothetical protein
MQPYFRGRGHAAPSKIGSLFYGEALRASKIKIIDPANAPKSEPLTQRKSDIFML